MTGLEGSCQSVQLPLKSSVDLPGRDKNEVSETSKKDSAPLPRLGLAKAPSFGPPLQHVSAVKLFRSSVKVDKLRDGDIFVFCDENDRAEAKAKAKASGANKAKNKQRKNRTTKGPSINFIGSAQMGQSSCVEHDLKIHVDVSEMQ